VGDGDAASYTASAFDVNGNLLLSLTVSPTGGVYGELSLPVSGISFVDVTGTNFAWVADDLSFNGAAATPLPTTWTMMFIGLAGLGFVGYRRSRNRSPAAV
jgi:hypothetical protein